MSDEQAPVCQSCGMPMQHKGEFGTEEDGQQSSEYCCFCFQLGDFTAPDIDMEQMIERLVELAVREGRDEAEARAEARRVLPELGRWQEG